MIIQNRPLRVAIVTLLVLLVIPLIVMLGMMLVAGVSGAGSMSGMMGGMSAGMMALRGLWSALVAAALIFLIVLLTRNSLGSQQYRGISAAIPREIDDRKAA